MSWVALVGWLVVAAAFAVCEVLGHRRTGTFPSLVDVARAFLASRSARWLVLVAWVWSGVHLFVRHG